VSSGLPTFVVGIGGSAGSLDAYKELLLGLSAQTGMAFVFISHLSPTDKSRLPGILATWTEMPVQIASEGMELERNHVYVIAPNADLSMVENHFNVTMPRTMALGRHRQVDHFLMSISAALGRSAIGVILSGGHKDGTEGCKHIKKAGGITFAQNSNALHDSMPSNARASGYIEFVMSPAEISQTLALIATFGNSTN
jgi:two-component system CheB/CheR fusion protein